MIIRRRHTSNFANISNALRDDERLEADEVGILYYLLTQPADWEVRLPQLRKRWRMGTDRMKRIYWNWMRTGWCRAEKVRLKETGHFYINFEIWPEPGPGMTDAEIRQALSVGSTESDPEDAPDSAPDPGGSEPGVGHQGVETGGVAYIESTKTDLQNTDSTKAPALWRDIRAAWPQQELRSPSKCEQLFAALSPDDRQKAFDGISPYLANCRASDRKLCDLSTYLKERRFNGNLSVPTTSFPIHGNTPQAYRWTDYWLANGLGSTATMAETLWKQRKPYYTRSEWPPTIKKAS